MGLSGGPVQYSSETIQSNTVTVVYATAACIAPYNITDSSTFETGQNLKPKYQLDVE